MRLLALCFILLVSLIAEVFSNADANTPFNREGEENFQELSATSNPVNETALQEGRNDLEICEKIVKDLLGLNDEIVKDVNGDEGRTFGVKRLQFMMMPMMYKMGVMMTLLVVLTVISLKGLAVGVLLLVLKLAAFFGKLYALGHQQPSHGWSPQSQPIHVHVHNNGGGYHHHPPLNNAWEPASGYAGDEHYYYKA